MCGLPWPRRSRRGPRCAPTASRRANRSPSMALRTKPSGKRRSPATNFLQRDPENGEPATERTEVRVVFDRDRIILGITCFDSEPARLLGNQMQRDQPFAADDRFMFAIDPFFDGRTGYFFEINPSGAMGDGLITESHRRRRLRRRDEQVVGRHLARARAAHGDRLDRGGRDSVQDPQLRSRRRHLGRELSAHGEAQERRESVDRVAAQ